MPEKKRWPDQIILPGKYREVSLKVAFLVVGDPFGATTHSDLVLRAKELGVPHQVLEYRPDRSKTAAVAVVNIHRE